MACQDKIKKRCGRKSAALCVDYEGTLHAETLLDACDDLSVQVVIEDINTELDDINSELDLSALGNNCLSYTLDTSGNIITKNALLAMETKICELVTFTGFTTGDTSCEGLMNTTIACQGFTFGALVDACGTQPTTLGDLLQVMITQININT